MSSRITNFKESEAFDLEAGESLNLSPPLLRIATLIILIV